MSGIARVGDLVVGGLHCHGHSHGPQPSPGRIISGASKVFADGRLVARTGDSGYSAVCCGGVGKIIISPSQQKVFVQGKPAAGQGTPTEHCGIAPGRIKSGSKKVLIL
jgi:uncharacterized Zn-binding protein involved in type VI secretion